MSLPSSVLGWLCLAFVAAAATILLRQLVKRPQFTPGSKMLLAVGLGLFPALAAVTSTAEGMRATTKREFCGSCHVMHRHLQDLVNPDSLSLAARHAKSPFFSDRNCYVCHADYGMFGYVATKLNGMKHVWKYYTDGYAQQSTDEAVARLKLYHPYDNKNCMQCHSGTAPTWLRVPEHNSLKPRLLANEVSCASAGCHGYAHPFTKGPAGQAHASSASIETAGSDGTDTGTVGSATTRGSATKEEVP